jgi:D-amino-acid dehydrogenase
MKDIVIIGGGIIGLSTAYYARKAGHNVTVIERSAPKHDGCSLGNAGMIVPSHFVPLAAPGMVAYGLRQLPNPQSPFWIRPRLDKELIAWGMQFMKSATREHVTRSSPLLRDLNNASRQCYIEWAEEFNFGLKQEGLLMLCRTPEALHEEVENAKKARGLGIPAEEMTPQDAAALDTKITMDISGAVYFPNDAHLNPSRLMASLTLWLMKNGATFCWDTEVTGVLKDVDNRIVALQTNHGMQEGDEFVIAGGSWSNEIGRLFSTKLPLQAGKGYSITLEKPRELPKICAIFVEARVAVTPMDGRLRIGGTMELGGGNDTSINPRRVQGIVSSVPHYYPKFTPDDFKDAPVWAGLRPCTPDGLPYIGRIAAHSNVTVATGHAMMGLSLGPITGKLVTQLISGAEPTIDIALLNPERFG